MKKQTVPLADFDLPRFIGTIVTFWGDHEAAFPLLENGFADFGLGCLDDDAEDPGDEPLQWLQHGLTLFGQFTRSDDSTYSLADGTEIEVPEDDESEFMDDSSTFGFLVNLADDVLTIQTAVLRDLTGECTVETVDHAGVFETNMVRFIRSMKRAAR
jgi:hypothetical protein